MATESQDGGRKPSMEQTQEWGARFDGGSAM